MPFRQRHWFGLSPNARGGKNEIFNCNSVKINENDLKSLGVKTLEGSMPYTTGFYFGQSTKEHDIETLEFIAKALKVINEGKYDMYYISGW